MDLIQVNDEPIHEIYQSGFDVCSFIRRGALIAKGAGGHQIDEDEFKDADCEGRA